MRRFMFAMAAAMALIWAAPFSTGSAKAAETAGAVHAVAQNLAERALATPAEYAQYRRYYRHGYYRPRHYYRPRYRYYRPYYRPRPYYYGRPWGHRRHFYY